jgi:ABC-type dipeptide/oligopeptide/nickel transport system permease component
MMGLQFAALLSGAVLTETVFNWPGIGSSCSYLGIKFLIKAFSY